MLEKRLLSFVNEFVELQKDPWESTCEFADELMIAGDDPSKALGLLLRKLAFAHYEDVNEALRILQKRCDDFEIAISRYHYFEEHGDNNDIPLSESADEEDSSVSILKAENFDSVFEFMSDTTSSLSVVHI